MSEKQLEITSQPSGTPDELIKLALQQDADIDKLDKLLTLKERWDAKQHRVQFFHALNQFQYEIERIEKNKSVDFTTKQGRVTYEYASLDSIIEQIKEPVHNAGLTYRWEIEDKEQIRVTCIITHVDGHSEHTTMSGTPDTSGVKNPIQSRASTITYLQRYTLIGALGLGTAQNDSDSRSQNDGEKLHPDMEMLIDECTDSNQLEQIWKQNKELHNFAPFKIAVNSKLDKLKGASQ